MRLLFIRNQLITKATRIRVDDIVKSSNVLWSNFVNVANKINDT